MKIQSKTLWVNLAICLLLASCVSGRPGSTATTESVAITSSPVKYADANTPPPTLPANSPVFSPGELVPRLVSPTIGEWFIKAWQVKPARFGYEFISWHNDTSLRFEGSNRGDAILDVTKPDMPADILIEELDDRHRLLSPDGQYLIVCDNGIDLFHLPDNQQIGHAAIQTSSGGCSAIWSPDNSAVAILEDETDGIHVWGIDGSEPRKIATTVPFGGMAWSPDGNRIAYAQSKDEWNRLASIMLIDKQGQPLLSSPFNIAFGDYIHFWWLTNDILVSCVCHNSSSTYRYYRVSTREFLVSWSTAAGGNPSPRHQLPMYSFNYRWLALDTGKSEESHDEFSYSVFDFQTGQNYVLTTAHLDHKWEGNVRRSRGAGKFVEFLGWKDDDSVLYFVTLPTDMASAEDPNSSFGFMAFDPLTRKSLMLVENARQVEMSPDHRWALIVVSTDDPHLFQVGMWNSETSAIESIRMISGSAYYGNPAWSMKIVPTSWSHDGKQVVFANSTTSIALMNTEGDFYQLAVDLPQDFWLYQYFDWSPDDRFVLVNQDVYIDRLGLAWVIDVANP
ncbi:MAG: PD40 domain-containing protein [Chloroflexi bacterium]|nr:PD40 domain-containing protein [Chloroflexota bacterium]